jgi:AcrR family transcriptional regulator
MATLRADTRARIIEAARRRFYTHGVGATSLGDLARASGVPKGNFYYHFPTREDVVAAVVEARCADAEASFVRWRAELASPRARLGRFLEMVAAEREQLVRYGCPVGSMATELGKYDDVQRALGVSVLLMYEGFVREQMSLLCRDAGRAARLARRLLGRVQGAIVMAHATGDATALDEELDACGQWLDALADSAA